MTEAGTGYNPANKRAQGILNQQTELEKRKKQLCETENRLQTEAYLHNSAVFIGIGGNCRCKWKIQKNG